MIPSFSESKTFALRKVEEKKVDLSSRNSTFKSHNREGLATVTTESQSKSQTVQSASSVNSFIPNRNLITSQTNASLIKDLPQIFNLLEKSYNYMTASTEELEEVLEDLKNEEDFKRVHNKLRSANKCGVCGKRELVTMSFCGHSFCKKCAENLISHNKGCQACNEPFSHSFKLIAALKSNHSSKMQLAVLCLLCNSREINTLSEATCDHLCLDCVSNCFHSGEDDCPICWKPLFESGEYLARMQECEGCRKSKRWLEDYFGKSKCHTMCGQCLEESVENKRCKVCSHFFNSFDLLKIVGFISQQCQKCQKIVPRWDLARQGKNFLCRD